MAVKKEKDKVKARTKNKSGEKAKSFKKIKLIKKASLWEGSAGRAVKSAAYKSKNGVKKTIKSSKTKTGKNSSEKPVVLKAVKTNLSAKELEYFKNLILEEKKDILENARRLRESLVDENTGEYVGDNSTFSMHMAEQGSDEMEREKAFMFIQRDEKYLGYLEEALDKINKKTYGICVECMYEPKKLCKTCPYIPKQRLEVVPITQHCLECKMAKWSD